jgi:hypothetical protein
MNHPSKQQSPSDAHADQIVPNESRNEATPFMVAGLDMNGNSSLEELAQSRTDYVNKPWAALCAVMRDEDLYINEWTDYHLALGFQHIFIYDSHPNFTLSEWHTTEWRKKVTMCLATCQQRIKFI